MRRTLAAALLSLGATLLAPPPARAQYFGQNKVQYRAFDFQIVQTQHFDVYYYGREREAALDAARMAERAYARLSRILQHQWLDRKPLLLYASQSDFQQTNAVQEDLGEGTGGVTDFFKHRMVLPFTGSYADFEHVLQHEMVHAFQYDVFSRGQPGAGLEAISRINPPLWFMEGMAEYLSIGPVDPHTAMWLRDAAVEGNLPTIEQLTDDPRIFPYRFGHAIWAYIGQRWGDETIGAILQGTMAGGGLEQAFRRVLGESLDQLSDDWRDAVQSMYLPQIADHQRARRFAHAVLNKKNSQGTLHVSPQITPDGRSVAYLSERNFFFVDLYLADAETGRVRRKLVSSSIDPNFETLRFINSTGSWSPDGTRYAFAAKAGEADNLVILDVPHDRVVARLNLGLDAITNPSWAPDGRRLVFTGYDGGWSDLYVVDQDGSNLRRLTDDRYADLLPVWSPDGRTIAFSTDRGPGTDFSILRFSNLRIALYWLDGDSIAVLPGMDVGKNVNPVWSPDGHTLAFLSDRSGIDNVFLYDFDARQVYQITNAYTGVSGITDLSPAISWAREADRMLITYYEDGEYNVYAIDNPRSLKRDPWVEPQQGWIALANASALPLKGEVALSAQPRAAPAPPGAPAVDRRAPAASSIYRSGSGAFRPSAAPPPRSDSAAPPLSVAALLDSATLALPDTTTFTLHPYKVRFTPDYVSRPTIGYQRDNFGRGIFGGTAIQMSDILGNNTLIFSGAVNGRISEAQVLMAYLNASHRWNWAVGFDQQPLFFYGGSTFEPGAGPSGSDVITERLQRLVFRELFTQAQYPLNRFRRLELGARYTNVSVATLSLRTAVLNGQVVGYADSTSEGGSLNLYQPSLALVYDNSLFGYTSPFFGKRYRFEVAPVFGSWHYWQLLGDYRRYDMITFPFTIATRALFLGRVGRDGDLFPVFIGQPDLVRGYTFGSYDASMCSVPISASSTGCPELDQLIGSRIAVASAEFRFFVIRNLTLGFLPIGFPPIEGALWYDAGLAWNSTSSVRLDRSPTQDVSAVRSPVTSYGVGLRANLFGIAILRLDYAVPQQRPGHGGYWILSLGPPF